MQIHLQINYLVCTSSRAEQTIFFSQIFEYWSKIAIILFAKPTLSLIVSQNSFFFIELATHNWSSHLITAWQIIINHTKISVWAFYQKLLVMLSVTHQQVWTQKATLFWKILIHIFDYVQCFYNIDKAIILIF